MNEQEIREASNQTIGESLDLLRVFEKTAWGKMVLRVAAHRLKTLSEEAEPGVNRYDPSRC